jgi:hypothetical protein
MTNPRQPPTDAQSLYTQIEKTPKGKTNPKTLKPGDLLHLVWEDAQTYGCETWENETPPQLATTHSIGWLLHQTNTHITLITLLNQHAYGNGITIPTNTIQHITKLKT